MKFATVTGSAAALLFLGTIAPIFAQHEGEGGKQEKSTQQPGRPQERAQPPQQTREPQRTQPAQPQRQSQERAPATQRALEPARPTPQAQQTPQPAEPPPAKRAQQIPQPAPAPQRTQQARRPAPQERPQAQQARQQPRPAPQQQAQQRAQPSPAPPQRTQQQARFWQQQRSWQQGGSWQAHDNWQQGRAQKWSVDHRSWAQRGGYGGLYIPQLTFGLYFGNQHSFRLSTRPVMYLGYPRFEYGGASFLLVDPWPEYWADNWYDADDLYIDYDNGYYLYNRSYPQVRLAIMVAV